MRADLLDQVRAIFGGKIPRALQHMHDHGRLPQTWPPIRAAYRAELPMVVIEALFTTLALRCKNHYCFVMHALFLVRHGASQADVEKLARWLEAPELLSKRWSRIVRLAWLAYLPGPTRPPHATPCSSCARRPSIEPCSRFALP